MSDDKKKHSHTRQELLDALIEHGSIQKAADALELEFYDFRYLYRIYRITRADYDPVKVETERKAFEDEVSMLRCGLTAATEVVAAWSVRMGMQQVPDQRVSHFDLGIIEEEVRELRAAVQSENLIQQLDALADIVYTILNVAFRRNIPLSPAVAEVHRSNSTKEPNGDGKPKKGLSYEHPDLEGVVEHWAREQVKIGAFHREIPQDRLAKDTNRKG